MALTNTDPFFTPYIRQDGTESKSKMFLTKTQAQILEAAAAKYGLTGELKKSFFVTPFAESGASVPVEINGVKHTIFTPQNYAASAYADGPFQFTPGTAASMGLENPNDFEESAYASAKYIKKLYDMAVKRGEKDPVAAATVYYNRGPKHTYNTGKETDTPLPNETKEYLKRKNNNKDNVYELVSKAMTEGIDEIRFLEPEVKKKSKARIAYEKKHGIATKTDEVAEIDKKAQREHDKELEAQRQKYFFDEQLKLQEKEERKKMLTETPLFKDIDLDVEAEKLGMYKKGGNVNLSAQEQTAKENEGFDLINNIPVIGNSIITSVNSVNALRDNKKENNAQAVGSLIGNVADMTALAFGIPTAGLGEKLGSAIGSNLSKKDSSQLVSSFYKPQFQKGGCTSCKLRKYSFQDGGYANGNYLNYRDNSGISEDYKRRTIERNKLLQDVIKEANRRIAENDYFHLPKHIANTEEMRGKNPNNYTCIGGVCDIFQTLGLIPKDSNVYNNSDFQQRAYSLNFVNNGNDISKLRPGSIIQYKHATNADGTNIPNHAQLFLGMTPDGRYRFFDNYYATSGHGTGERIYTKEEVIKNLTDVWGRGSKANDNYAQIWNYGYDVSDENMFKERRLPDESKLDRQYDNDDYKMHVRYQPGDNKYSYEVKEELPNDKLRFNTSREREQEIIDVFNDPEFDQKLKDTFLITQNTLDELKPVIYGIMSQESSFGAPINPVNNIKYKLEKLLPKNKVSKGLGAVNYSYMREPAKKLMESEVKSVGKGNALYKPKGGVIGTLDLLLQSGSAADNYMPENPELMDDHPWAPALYFYNGQGRNLKRGYASDGSTLNVEEGSYPHKVFTEAERLKRKKLQNGGYVYSIEGYKEDSPDRFNDYNLINSGNITMKGVNQPILGVDNLGNSKIMLPGKDYKFPGTKVLEKPLNKYQKGGDTAPSYEEYVATKKWWDGLSDAQKEHIHMRMLYPEHMKILEIGGKYYNSENALPTASITAKRLSKHVNKPISNQTQQREGDSFIENTIELFDPTGVSSWDDVGRAWGDGKFNYEDIIEPLGAIPAIGKPLSWGAKGVKAGMKAASAANKSGSLKRVYDLLNYGRDVYGDNINPNLKLGGSTDSNVITKFQLGGSTAGGTIPASEMKGTSTSSPIPLKNAVINTSTNPDNSNFSQFRNIPFNSPIQPGDVYNRGQSLAASELSLINSDEGRRRLDYMNRVGKDDLTIADPNRTSGQVLNRLGNSLLTTADPRNRSSSFGYNSNNNSITLNSKEPINGTLAFDINRAINDNKASWMDKYLIDNVKFTDDYLKKFDINSGKTPTSYLREARQEMVDAGIINSLYDEITSDHIIEAFNYFNNNENASNTEYDYTIENDPNIFRTINPDLRDGQENYLFNELSKLDNEKTTIKDEIRKLEKIISTPKAHTNTYLGTSSDINDEITKARNKIIQYEIRLGEIERDKQNINNTLENRSNINVVHGNKQKGLFFKNLRPSGKKGMDAILHIMNNLASNDKAQSPTTRMAKYGGEVDGRAQIEIEGDEYVFNADGLGREDFKMLNNEGITNSSDVGFLAKGDSHAKGGIGVITGKAYIGSKYLGLDGKKSSKTNPSVATEMLKQGGYALSNADSNDKFGLSKKYTPNAYKHTVNSMQKVADKAEYNKKIEESIKTIDESIKSIKSMNNRYYKSGGYMGKVYDPTRPSAYNSFKRGGMMESPLNLTYDQDLLQYQMGGEMPPEMASQEQAMMEQAMMEQAGGAPQGPEQGGGSPLDSIPPEQKEQVMMLVEAAIQGDQEAMKQLVDIFGEDGVQMIMQEVGQGVQQQAPNPSNDAAMAAMQAAPGEGMQGAMPPTAPPPMMRGGYMMGRGGYMKTPSQYLRSYMGGY